MKKKQISARLLPVVYQRAVRDGGPLSAILDVMEQMHTPSEGILDRLNTFFSPYHAPESFVPFLASWVDLELLLDPATGDGQPSLSTGAGRLRELTAAASTLSRWRGTAKGLQLFLQTATGEQRFVVEERVKGSDGAVQPFHIRITAPAMMAAHRTLIERVIEVEKPAYVTYELNFMD